MSIKGKRAVSIEQALDHRILHGLSCEWEVAIWMLDESFRSLLRKPIFSLREMDRRLGYWDPVKKEISLSRSFVSNHSWYAVRDVLVHEIAHQVAYQVFGVVNETAHGPAFQKACGLLRIDADATGRYQALTEHSECGESDKILIRVKKLLALAESQNVHEAEAAMLKAHELIAKYNVDLLALNEKRDFTSMLVCMPALRHTREKYHLANLLQDFYFVQGIWVPAYVVGKGKMGRAFEISGTAQNLEIASYVYDFISNYILAQWLKYNEAGLCNHHRRTDFAVGVLDGFRKKMEITHKKENSKRDDGALIAIKDSQLLDYMAFKYPHTRSVRRGTSNVDSNVIRAGMAIGENLVISKGISEKGKGRKLIGCLNG